MTPRLVAIILAFAAPANASTQSDVAPFMEGEISTDRNEYNISVSDDERTMVFARSEADFADARIMVSERTTRDMQWRSPKPISFSDGRYRDSDPWLTPDGRTLYFVSDRPTAARPDKRDLDIWRSVRRNDAWSRPEHLGDAVNGPGEELGPEMHGNVLYFSSARRSGTGGLDIYVAQASERGFGQPELLPPPINSPASESDFTVSKDGRTALFWRQVEDGGLLHVSRLSADGSWSVPEPLSSTINIGPFNFTPAFSRDGSHVTFASTRARDGQPLGMADIYERKLPIPAE